MRRDIDRRHIELFPNNRFLPKDDVVRLKQIVMHAQAGEQKLVTAFVQLQIMSIREYYL
jgi:hypothetical protein